MHACFRSLPDGESGQRRFIRWLAVTMPTAYVLMAATNLLVLLVAWFLTSMGLHKLLTHDTDRPDAVPGALLLLSVVGTLTVAIGLLTMWAQVTIKRILAWSTVSQMRFMMVPCRLAAFPAAALHIVGHGFYKAHCFLRSGVMPPPLPRKRTLSPLAALSLAFAGSALARPARRRAPSRGSLPRCR